MRASQLIKKLQKAVDIHGDCEVVEYVPHNNNNSIDSDYYVLDVINIEIDRDIDSETFFVLKTE